VCPQLAADEEELFTNPEYLMEEVVQKDNMTNAYKRVKSNKRSPGIDGVSVDELKIYCQEQWSLIREQLLGSRYHRQAVLKVDIPKPGGDFRTLGIPTAIDRLIQQAVLQILQPVFEPHFSEYSFGFSPGRSAKDAVEQARAYIDSGYNWVVDIDLSKFFDRVNHDILMNRVSGRVKDKRLLRLIGNFLRAGMSDGKITTPRHEGTPQGGPLSPLLSNILLDDLDKELESRGLRFCRYADDCNIYVKSHRAAERVMESVIRFLEKKLKLKVNRDKSDIDRPWKRKFLGYTFLPGKKTKLRISPESVKRLRVNLKDDFRRGKGRRLEDTIRRITYKLRGWFNYYDLSEVKRTFSILDEWIRRRLRNIIWRQWKRRWTRFKGLLKRGLAEERAVRSAFNNRGPWWNSGASHMNYAFKISYFNEMGLFSLLNGYLGMC
jgi:RNA-directed DNA polymerase